MLYLRSIMSKMMDQVAISKNTGHLLLQGYYPQKFQKLPMVERIKMDFGFTTHPAFEVISDVGKCYRLKPGFSASVALDELLHIYETSVDCGLASLIAYYLGIRATLCKIYGHDRGKQRFDAFFGSTTKDVPLERRLLLSPEGPIMGTHKMAYRNDKKDRFPIQPLSFILGLNECKNKTEFLAKIEIGAMLMFVGDPDYRKIHPCDSDGGYVCTVSNKTPLKMRTFGFGSLELTEEDLIAQHKAAYRARPTADSIVIAQGRNLSIQQRKPEADPRNIVGLALFYIDFKPKELEFLFLAEPEQYDQAYNAYLALEKLKIEAAIQHKPPTLMEDALKKLTLEEKNVATPSQQDTSTFGFNPGFLAKRSIAVKQRRKPVSTSTPKATDKPNEFGFKTGFLTQTKK